MKIVLREDVEHLGHRGDIVKVAAGYARNYLLPKGLAYEANDGNLKTLKAQERAWKHRVDREMYEAEKVLAKIEAHPWIVKKKAGESGTLYGSVTNSELAELMAEEGIEIDRRKIVMKHPVKALGETAIPVKLHSRVTATLRLEVQSDGALATESASIEAEAADAVDAAEEAAEEGGAAAKEATRGSDAEGVAEETDAVS